jgi:uncharacterized membrane protein
VLIAVALERLAAGKLRMGLIALAALLFVKEDMGFLVAGIGLYLAVSRPRLLKKQVLVGMILVVVGLADSVIATYLLVPAFGGRADYYWAYPALGNNVPQALGHLIVHPASSLRLLITPRVKLDTMLWLLGAFCFLSLRSPIALAAIPLLLERMLATKFPNWWVTSFQYNAYLVMVFAFAAVDGAARLDRWSVLVRKELAAGRAKGAEAAAKVAARGAGTVALGCAVAMFAVAVYLVPRFAFGAALHPPIYHRTAQMNAAAAAVAVVPAGVTVEAVNNLGPQLSGRDTVLLWDGEQAPLGSPWIIGDVWHHEFTFSSVTEQRQRVALLQRTGYRIVFERDGYVVLHRSGQRAHTASTREGTG